MEETVKLKLDERDPLKKQIGEKILSLADDGDEDSIIRALIDLELSEKEIMDILHDPEYWVRDNQFVGLEEDDEPITILLAGRGFGKDLDKSISILTGNRGWITIGEVEIGDTVYDEQGNLCNVIDYQEPDTKKAYEITFDTGEKVIVGEDHLWTTWTHQARKCFGRNVGGKYPKDWYRWSFTNPTKKNAEPIGPKTLSTEEIAQTFRHGKRGDLNHSIPNCAPLEVASNEDLPLHPYLVGFWLGDGSKNGGVLAGIDTEIFKRIESLGYDVNHETKSECTVYVRGITKQLREIGIFKNKHVPDSYKINSIENRLELLRGLMDSDGFIHDKNFTAEFCNMNKQMAESVLELACSFGEKATLITGRATFNGKDCGEKYRVTWTPTNVNPFWLERKAVIAEKALTKTTGQVNRARQRMMKDIREVPIPEAGLRCLSVDSPSHLFLVGKTFIPTHNSYSIAAAVHRAIEKKGIKSILLVSRTVRDLRSVVVPAIEQFWYEGHPNKPTFNKNNGEMKWPNGAEALCVAAESGEDAVRGQNVELFICDEFAFYGNNEGIITQGMLALRKGISKFIGATTPFASPRLIEWVNSWKSGDKAIKIVTGSTMENSRNLSKTFLRETVDRLEGTLLGRQEIYGELILENPGALWQMKTIEDNYVKESDTPRMLKYSIGLDPAILSQKSSVGKKTGREPDSTGIVLSGMCENDFVWVLRDFSGSYTTEGWVAKACELFDQYRATGAEVTIVVEVNTIGEESLEYYFRQAKRMDVWRYVVCTYSTRSKLQRAQPYALLTEQGKVKLVSSKNLEGLISEMTTYSGSGKSPNHLDAFVQSCMGLKPMNERRVEVKELLM